MIALQRKEQTGSVSLPGLVVAALAAACPCAIASEVDGFTQPYRTVNVSAPEMGVIEELHVQEGELIRKGQPLARLDGDILFAQLAIAEFEMKTEGAWKAARAEVLLRTDRLQRLEKILASGHARPEEVERARADKEIAESRLLAVEEERTVKKLDARRLQVQIDRRIIRAPIDGYVARTHKELGEFVSPNDPHLLQIVQLDPLLAIFTVPTHEAADLKANQLVAVQLPGHDRVVKARIALVSAVSDAESGTVRVKVELENPDGEIRSGERCVLAVPDAGSSHPRPSR